jgi:hypothetical protein
MQRALTEGSPEASDPAGAALAETLWRAGHLQQGLAPDSEPGNDPVATRMDAIRSRLQSVREQLGVKPD